MKIKFLSLFFLSLISFSLYSLPSFETWMSSKKERELDDVEKEIERLFRTSGYIKFCRDGFSYLKEEMDEDSFSYFVMKLVGEKNDKLKENDIKDIIDDLLDGQGDKRLRMRDIISFVAEEGNQERLSFLIKTYPSIIDYQDVIFEAARFEQQEIFDEYKNKVSLDRISLYIRLDLNKSRVGFDDFMSHQDEVLQLLAMVDLSRLRNTYSSFARFIGKNIDEENYQNITKMIAKKNVNFFTSPYFLPPYLRALLSNHNPESLLLERCKFFVKLLGVNNLYRILNVIMSKKLINHIVFEDVLQLNNSREDRIVQLFISAVETKNKELLDEIKRRMIRDFGDLQKLIAKALIVKKDIKTNYDKWMRELNKRLYSSLSLSDGLLDYEDCDDSDDEKRKEKKRRRKD